MTKPTSPAATYSLHERRSLLRELAADPDVTVGYTDTEFQPCEGPPQAAAMGLRPTPRFDDTIPRALGLIVEADHPKILLQLNHARKHGIGLAQVRTTHDAPFRAGQTILLHVIDMREEWDVVVWASGGSTRHIDLESSDRRTTLAPRRIVQHRDQTAQILWVDEGNEMLLGWTPEQMIGESSLRFIYGPDESRAVESWIAMLADEPLDRTRIRYITASGDYRWMDIKADNRLSTDGYVEVEMIDAHDEMTALARARSNEAQFEALTDSLPVGVIQKDANGSTVYANHWIRTKMLHADDDHARAGHVHPDDRDTFDVAFQHVIATGEPIDTDIRIIAGDGAEHRCRTRIRSLGVNDNDESLGAIASVEDMTDTIDLQEQLELQAQTDFLTGLPNRAALTEWLDHQLRDRGSESKGSTVLFFDLDGFKRVNDGLGHEAGDRLLQAVSERISDVIRPTDLLARIGGDEFVIACDAWIPDEPVAALAHRVLAAFEDPIVLGETAADVGCSIGIARTRDVDGGETLLGNADIAMYEAKRAGGRRWSLYEDGLRDKLETQFQTESEIRRGLVLGEFNLHLQPIVDLSTGLTVAAEALVRWEHPDHGLLLPKDFIPAAERSGLIRQLGRWVIEDACVIAARAEHQFAEPLRVSMNLSGRQLLTDEFHDEIIEIIEQVGVDPSLLILEVTETAFIDTTDDIMFALHDLAALGLTIALDDFGTGFSSLNHLRLMPARIVKIDASYTAELGIDAGTTAITEAMVGLSRNLGHELVVEGIETHEQLERLRNMGVRLGQGFLLARPMPERDFFALDRTRTMISAHAGDTLKT